MSDGSDRLSKLAYFLVGGGIGAVVALLVCTAFRP